MKKVLLLLLCLMLIASTVIGCSSTKTESTPAPSEEESQAPEKSSAPEDVVLEGDVTFWGGAHLTNISEIVLEDFAAANPGVNISYEKYPFAEYPTKMKLQLSSNQSDPDIMIIHDFLAKQFIKAGWVLDITDEVPREDLLQNYETIVDGSKVYGIPMQSTCMTFMYREDIFNDLGLTPPTNLDEYVALADTLKENGYFIDAYDPSVNAKDLYLIFLNMIGGGIYDKEGNVILDTDAGKGAAALEMVSTLYESGIWHKSYSYHNDEYWTAMNDGQIAAIFGPSYAAAYFDTNVDPEGAGGYGLWKIAAPPKIAEDGLDQYQESSTYYIVNSMSDQSELATEIIKYLGCSVDAGKTFTEINREGTMARVVNNYIPSLESIAQDSAPWPAFGDQKVLSFVAETMLAYCPMTAYKDSRAAETDTIVDQTLAEYFVEGNMTIEETITEMAGQINGLEIK